LHAKYDSGNALALAPQSLAGMAPAGNRTSGYLLVVVVVM
jgi:hypothetical protein